MNVLLLMTIATPSSNASILETCYQEANAEYTTCTGMASAEYSDAIANCDALEDENEIAGCQAAAAAQYATNNMDCHASYSLQTYGCEQQFSNNGAGFVTPDYPCDGGIQDGLGRCVTPFTEQTPEDLIPDDGCPAGQTRGRTDECEPILFTGEIVPLGDGLSFYFCPPGMTPGLIGGCTADIVGVGPNPDNVDPGWICNGGLVPGPDDGCGPMALTMELGPIRGANMARKLIEEGTLTPATAPAVLETLSAQNVLLTDDIGATVETTREAIESGEGAQ